MRLLKLINDERRLTSILSQKGCAGGPDLDYCSKVDQTHCTYTAYDSCNYDYSSCNTGGYDLCHIADYGYCSNNSTDICGTDY